MINYIDVLIEVNETIFFGTWFLLIFMIAVGMNVPGVMMLDVFSADEQRTYKSQFLGKS